MYIGVTFYIHNSIQPYIFEFVEHSSIDVSTHTFSSECNNK